MNRRVLMQRLGYAVFALVSFLLCFYLHFPQKAVAERLVVEINRLSGAAWLLGYEQTTAFSLTGIGLKNVTLRENSSPATLGRPVWQQKLALLQARLALWPLLWGQKAVYFYVQPSNAPGNLAGYVTVMPPKSADWLSFWLRSQALSLGDFTLLRQWLGAPLGGLVSGEVSGVLRHALGQSQAAVQLKVKNAKLGAGSIQGFALPATALGLLTLDAKMAAGKVQIVSMHQEGGAFALKLSGNAVIGNVWPSSHLNVCMRLRPDQAYLQANPSIAGMLRLLEIQFKRDLEGYIHIPVQGSPQAPQFGHDLCKV